MLVFQKHRPRIVPRVTVLFFPGCFLTNCLEEQKDHYSANLAMEILQFMENHKKKEKKKKNPDKNIKTTPKPHPAYLHTCSLMAVPIHGKHCTCLLNLVKVREKKYIYIKLLRIHNVSFKLVWLLWFFILTFNQHRNRTWNTVINSPE